MLDLIEDNAHLILYHFKFTSSVAGSLSTGCSGCKMYIDGIDRAALRQLEKRDTSFALVSRAPIERLQAYKKQMSWRHTWVSSTNSAADSSEDHGVSIYTRKGDQLYLTTARSSENVGPIWSLLDLPTLEPVS